MKISNMQVTALAEKIVEDRRGEWKKEIGKLKKLPAIKEKVKRINTLKKTIKKYRKMLEKLDPEYHYYNHNYDRAEKLAENLAPKSKKDYLSVEKVKRQILVASIEASTLEEIEKKVK